MAYDLVVNKDDENANYISLADGAGYSGYSQDYLRFRIRQGKLRARKIGRNWLTTREWLDEYLQKVSDYKEKLVAPKMVSSILDQSIDDNVSDDSVEEKIEEPTIDEEQAEFLTPVFQTEPEKEEPLAISKTEEKCQPKIYNIEPNPNPKPSAVDEKLHLFVDPKPMAVFNEPEEEMPAESAPWLKYAFAVIFVCGILGFTIGFNYSYLKPTVTEVKDIYVDQTTSLVKSIINPIFSEQFTASFGIIFEQVGLFGGVGRDEINPGGENNIELPPSPVIVKDPEPWEDPALNIIE